MLDLVWLIPAFPLFGAVVLLLLGKRIGEPAAGWIATLLAGLAFLASVVMFLELRSLGGEERAHVYNLFTWLPSGGLRVELGFLLDPLSSTMTLFVTGVGTLIHLYSIGYMHGDARFSRFFAYLNLFLATMLVLVLGSSFLVTFLGWEGVGLCSYLLVSFWFERRTAALAGKKAFVTNRVGDFGFMLAMFLIFEHLGTLDYAGMNEGAAQLANGTATGIALLLFLGAIGKSAQLPLHIWLPDAMEGPTPVSALIHAATMVTAGVFLVCRAHPFFEASGSAGEIVAWVGAATALYAATVALVHNDIKRVLAYSTISQLGYMFLAAGIGAYSAAMFHMVTHAFFKALLFLGAGSVMHGLHNEQDMRRMGGLRRYMPVTAGTFIVAWLAIAGIVPLAGFWSKDEILAKAWFDGAYGLWLVGAATAFLTALYMARQVFLVFFGNERWREPVPAVSGGADDAAPPKGKSPRSEAEHAGAEQADAGHAGANHAGAGHAVLPHESPRVMTFPLVVLAGLTVFGGLLNLPFRSLELLTHWLEPVFEGVDEIHASSFGVAFVLSTLAVGVGVAGIYVAALLYRRGLRPKERDPLDARLGPAATFFHHAWYVDEGVSSAVRGPVGRGVDWLSRVFDQRGIDGAVNGIATVVRAAGGRLRGVQTGLVRNYALGIVLGTAGLLLFLVVRAA